MLKTVLKQFGFDEADCAVTPFGSGLINSTWLIEHEQKKYILQRINHDVFLHPEDIAFNIRLVGNYLKEHFPYYLFVHPCLTIDGDDMIKVWESYFRMFPFVEGSHTVNTVVNPEQAIQILKERPISCCCKP